MTKLNKEPSNKKLIEEHLFRFLSEQAEEDVTFAQMSRLSQGSDGQPRTPKKPQPGKGADKRDNGTTVKDEEAQNWLKDAIHLQNQKKHMTNLKVLSKKSVQRRVKLDSRCSSQLAKGREKQTHANKLGCLMIMIKTTAHQ